MDEEYFEFAYGVSGIENHAQKWLRWSRECGDEKAMNRCQGLNYIGSPDSTGPPSWNTCYVFGQLPDGLLGRWLVLTHRLRIKDGHPTGRGLVYQAHYLAIRPEAFNALDNNFRYLTDRQDKWPLQASIPVDLVPQALEQKVSLADLKNGETAASRLRHLSAQFSEKRGQLTTLLEALFVNRPCAITNFEDTEKARLDLIEILVLLLPRAIRPKLAFATRVFQPDRQKRRVIFASSAPGHTLINWQSGELTLPDHEALVELERLRERDGAAYCQEVTALLFDPMLVDIFRERLVRLGASDSANIAVPSSELLDGAALVSHYLNDMRIRRDDVDLWNPEGVDALWGAWKELATDALEPWRLESGSLDPPLFIKYADAGLLSGDLAVRHAAREIQRLHNADPQTKKDVMPALANVLRHDRILERVARELASGADVRVLVAVLSRDKSWSEGEIKTILDSSGINELPAVKRLLPYLIEGEKGGKNPVCRGADLRDAYEEMGQDHAFLASALTFAIDNNRSPIVGDIESLKLSEMLTDADSIVKTLLDRISEKLSEQAGREAAPVVTRLAVRLENISAFMHLLAFYLRDGKMAVTDEWRACVMKFARSLDGLLEDALSDERLAKSPPADLLVRCLKLVNELRLTPNQAAPLAKRAALLVQQLDSEKVEFSHSHLQDIFRLYRDGALVIDRDHCGWVPLLFRGAIRSQDDNTLETTARDFARYLLITRKRNQDEAMLLLRTVGSKPGLGPREQCQAYRLLQEELRPSEAEDEAMGNELSILAGESLAAEAFAQIQSLRQRYASDIEPSRLTDQLARNLDEKIASQDSVSEYLQHFDAARFSDSLFELFNDHKPLDKPEAVITVLCMTHWLGNDNFVHGGNWRKLMDTLFRNLSERGGVPVCRYCIEEVWKRHHEHKAWKEALRNLLTDYAWTDPSIGLIRWIFAVLPDLTVEALRAIRTENLRKNIKAVKPSTWKILSHLASFNDCLAPSAEDLIASYEKECVVSDEEVFPGFLAGVLNFALDNKRTDFVDAKCLKWLAELDELDDPGPLRATCEVLLEKVSEECEVAKADDAMRDACAKLAIRLGNPGAVGRIFAHCVAAENDTTSLENELRPVCKREETDGEGFIRAIVDAVDRVNSPEVLRRDLYVKLALLPCGTPARQPALQLLATAPIGNGSSFDDLKRLLDRNPVIDLDVPEVYNRAWRLASTWINNKYASNKQRLDEAHKNLVKEYLQWIDQKPNLYAILDFSSESSDVGNIDKLKALSRCLCVPIEAEATKQRTNSSVIGGVGSLVGQLARHSRAAREGAPEGARDWLGISYQDDEKLQSDFRQATKRLVIQNNDDYNICRTAFTNASLRQWPWEVSSDLLKSLLAYLVNDSGSYAAVATRVQELRSEFFRQATIEDKVEAREFYQDAFKTSVDRSPLSPKTLERLRNQLARVKPDPRSEADGFLDLAVGTIGQIPRSMPIGQQSEESRIVGSILREGKCKRLAEFCKSLIDSLSRVDFRLTLDIEELGKLDDEAYKQVASDLAQTQDVRNWLQSALPDMGDALDVLTIIARALPKESENEFRVH